MWIFSVAFLLSTPFTNHLLFSFCTDHLLTSCVRRCSRDSRVRTCHKTSASNKGRRTSHSRDSSRLVVTLLSALVAQVHMEEASLLRVASLVVPDRSLEALVDLECPHTDRRLQVGSHLGRASMAPLVPSLQTCLWVLLVSRTRTSLQQVLVVLRRSAHLERRSSRRRSPRLLRLTVLPNLQSPRQMQSRLEKPLHLQPRPNKRHRHPSRRSLISQLLLRRRTPSPHSRVVRRKRRVDRKVAASSQRYLSPAQT